MLGARPARGRDDERRYTLAAPGAHVHAVPERVAEPGADRRRSGTRQDNFGGSDPSAGHTERLGETGPDPDTQERPDSVAKRAVREVQPERPDLRWIGAGVEAGAWRAGSRLEGRSTRRVAGRTGCTGVQFPDAAIH